MGKKYKYQIGDWVAFDTHLKVVSVDGHRKAHEINFANEKIGQICGAKVRHLGDIEDEGSVPYGTSYLIIRKAVILYQIRTGMLNIPFEVRENDIRCIEQARFVHKKLPWKKVQLSNWAREQLSKAAKAQPRDSKGKFIRYQLRAIAVNE